MKATICFIIGCICWSANGSSLRGRFPDSVENILQKGSELWSRFNTQYNKECFPLETLTNLKVEAEALLKSATSESISNGFVLLSVQCELKELISEIDKKLAQSVQPDGE